MTPEIDSLKSQIAASLSAALRRHRSGESSRRVVESLSESMDGVLRPLFLEMMHADVSQVALLRPASGDWTVLTRQRGLGSIYKLSWSRDGSKLFFGFLDARTVYRIRPVLEQYGIFLFILLILPLFNGESILSLTVGRLALEIVKLLVGA